jgi:hypothetical protein
MPKRKAKLISKRPARALARNNQASRAPVKPPRKKLAPRHPRGDVGDIAVKRELFWQNVIREILTSLSVASAARPPAPSGPPALGAGSATTPPPGETRPDTPAPAGAVTPAELFDGRLAILTTTGQRIAIAEVFPVFACGIDGGHAERALSVAVECTVFQIRTPDGQVFTLPLHEIRGFHALSPDLMRRLEEMARADEARETDGQVRPFGFAAFASMPNDEPADSAPDAEPGPP